MWKTNDPLMQPKVDELNRMINSVLDAAISLQVDTSELILLIGFNRYKVIEEITNYNPYTMEKTFRNATIVKVIDPDLFEIVVLSWKAGQIAREAVGKEQYKLLIGGKL